MEDTLKKLQETSTPAAPAARGHKTFGDMLRSQQRARLGLESKGTANLIEETGSLGGFLVPDEFSNELIEVVRAASVVMPRARKYNMNSDVLLVPRISAGSSVYWEQTGGATNKTQTDVTLEQLTLTAKTVYGYAELSEQLVEDSDPDAVASIQRDLAGALVVDIDRAFLQGAASATDPLQGIVGYTGINTATAGADFTGDDILDMVGEIETDNFSPDGMVGHPSVKTILRKLKDSSGQYLWSDPRGDQAATVFGIPFISSSNMTATAGSRALILGKWNEAAVGMRRDVTMALSEHAAFRGDRIALRLTARVAFGLVHPAAFGTVTSI